MCNHEELDNLEHAQLMVVLAASAKEGWSGRDLPPCPRDSFQMQRTWSADGGCFGHDIRYHPIDNFQAKHMVGNQVDFVMFQIVCMLTGRTCCEVEAGQNWLAIDIKMQIEQEEGIPYRKLHLFAGCKLLDDDTPLGNLLNNEHAISQRTICFLVDGMKPLHTNYLAIQKDITSQHHTMIVDWLVKVHNKCKFHHETLFLAVALLNRYLAQVPVSLRRFKLVGITAMRVAAKHGENHFPSINDIVRICNNAYTPTELHTAEISMLEALEFRVLCPTLAYFLQFLEVGSSDEWWGHARFASYLAELSLHDVDMLRHAPSDIASAAHFVSKEVLGPWPNSAPKAFHPTEDCINDLLELMKSFSSTTCQASRNKLMLFLTEEQIRAVMCMGG